ncbi:protein crumbs homolog 3 [Amblyraja radiata]|uniref:protein crumbs homolog 3 n=1 Tax=Amblyraja radiata TaxID=386614 RepID=UPI001401C1BF|nr:protein crumbs homolog 3 [Amblyraja radiata]XP_032906704.1 protein crumbs homolog 3 [Amblyraja radiata]
MDGLHHLLLITALGAAASGRSFAENNTTIPSPTLTTQYKTPVAAIVVPCVVGGLLLIAIILALGIVKLKGKRREEGTYNPSQLEQSGARALPQHGLKLPPEERLI